MYMYTCMCAGRGLLADYHLFCYCYCLSFPRDMNNLIMNYLIIEGYKDAADRFSKETGIAPQIDLESVDVRRKLKGAISEGYIEEAIEKVNDLYPSVMTRHFMSGFRYCRWVCRFLYDVLGVRYAAKVALPSETAAADRID